MRARARASERERAREREGGRQDGRRRERDRETGRESGRARETAHTRSREKVLVFADPRVLRVGLSRACKNLARLLQAPVGVEEVRVVAQRRCSPWLHLYQHTCTHTCV